MRYGIYAGFYWIFIKIECFQLKQSTIEFNNLTLIKINKKFYQIYIIWLCCQWAAIRQKAVVQQVQFTVMLIAVVGQLRPLPNSTCSENDQAARAPLTAKTASPR